MTKRIKSVYFALEGTDDPRGARAWFARTARVTPRYESWPGSGKKSLQAPADSLSELLERLAEAENAAGLAVVRSRGTVAVRQEAHKKTSPGPCETGGTQPEN